MLTTASTRHHSLRALALCLAATVMACDDSVGPQVQHDATFSLTATGSSTVDLEGSTLVLPTEPGGFRSVVNGREIVRDVTPLLLARLVSSLSTSPQLTVNVIGGLGIGTLRVHREGSAVGAAPEVQARLIMPQTDGSAEHYLIDAGTITVTSLDPLRATFALTGTQRLRLPASPTVGQSFTSQPAPISVTGRIGAP